MQLFKTYEKLKEIAPAPGLLEKILNNEFVSC